MKTENYIFGGFVAILLILLGYETYTFRSGGHHMMMSGMHAMGSSHHSLIYSILFSPSGIILLLLIVAFLYVIIKSSREETVETPAIKMLKERYARGDITREEYLQIFKEIVKGE